MQTLVSLLFAAIPLAFVSAEQLIPTADGTTWLYEMTQEAGEEFDFADAKPGPDGKVRAQAIYRITGTQELDGKSFLKFEMHRDGIVATTELTTVDGHGISCAARIDQYGELTRLDPPQTTIAAPLKTGATWQFDGKLGDSTAHQDYKVIGEEDIAVPAGKFHAFHIQAVQNSPLRMKIDRWFANGVGIVKDVTEIRMSDGDLLRRVSLELKTKPKVAPRPEAKPQVAKKISATVGKTPIGQATTQFAPDTPKIYARWQGRSLREGAKIRAAWIAENVGDVAPPNYTIDEANTTANGPNTHGTFTLSRPDDGWAPGDYRVEFYLDADLVETVKLKIAK
jgi:uncharacterized protein DUF3108